MQIEQLFCESVFSVYQKQMSLLNWIGTRNWQFDKITSSLTFLPDIHLEIQVLGLETNDGMWMWAWADDGNLPASSKRLASKMREFGVEKQIPEFTTPILATGPLQCGGHTLAVVAASQIADCPYFVCPDANATLFVVITDPDYSARPSALTLVDLANILPQLFADYAVSDHRITVLSAFKQAGIVPEESKHSICGNHDGVVLICKFNEIGLLIEVILQ